MRKPKIQPLTPLQLRILNIPTPLFFRHTVPYPVSLPIHIHIINLCRDKDQNHNQIDDEQVSVSAVVFGFVVFAVDEEGSYVTCLDRHLYHLLICV